MPRFTVPLLGDVAMEYNFKGQIHRNVGIGSGWAEERLDLSKGGRRNRRDVPSGKKIPR